MPSVGTTPFNLHVFTNWEALQILDFGDLMGASSGRHDPSFTPFSALLPALENGGQA